MIHQATTPAEAPPSRFDSESMEQPLGPPSEEGIRTTPFGGEGGNPFPMHHIREIGLRGGACVDQIRINGNSYGQGGGGDVGSITLGDDEYISKVSIHVGEEVDVVPQFPFPTTQRFTVVRYVQFTTNKGRSISAGSGENPTELDGIRLIGISGQSGKYVDKLNLMYVSNYKPSSTKENCVGFILGYLPPSRTYEEYESDTSKFAYLYSKVNESRLSQAYSASVEAEYYAKVTADAKIDIENTETETINEALEKVLERSTHTTQTIPEDSVGVFLVTGNLMLGADNKYWVYPTSAKSCTLLKLTDVGSVRKHYDLQGQLYTQMTGLGRYKTIRNGYTYYK